MPREFSLGDPDANKPINQHNIVEGVTFADYNAGFETFETISGESVFDTVASFLNNDTNNEMFPEWSYDDDDTKKGAFNKNA